MIAVKITREGFEAFSPYERGFVVYMYGADPEQPNVPDESNPYAPDTVEHAQWAKGQLAATLLAQDSEE